MEFTIKMPEDAVNKVLEILADKPYKEVAGLIAGIVQQTQSQVRQEEARKQAEEAKVHPKPLEAVPAA